MSIKPVVFNVYSLEDLVAEIRTRLEDPEINVEKSLFLAKLSYAELNNDCVLKMRRAPSGTYRSASVISTWNDILDELGVKWLWVYFS
jgi:hypothetical protein